MRKRHCVVGAVALLTVGTNLFITYNTALPSFDLGALTSVGSYMQVYDNDVLPQCLVDQLWAQLAPPPPNTMFSNNNGVCL